MKSSHPPLWSFKSHRFRIALVLMFAMFLMISNTSSLGMAIICMVNSTSHASYSDLPSTNRTVPSMSGCSLPVEEKADKHAYQGTLEWEPTKQSYLFSANYYGSLFTVPISGMLADRFGPKKLLFTVFTVASIITFFAPFLAQLDYWAYYTGRFIIGMGNGFVSPCINSLGGLWFPSTEKSSMAALYSSGVQISASASSLIGSKLCEVDLLGGWPLIFYMYGALGVVFLVFFYITITDHPSDNRWLTKEELIFLESTHPESSKKKKFSTVPWKSIFTSPAVYACAFCNLTFSFVLSINLNFLPTYFKEEFSLNLSSNGLYTMVPFLTQLFFKNVFAYTADYLKRSGRLTPTQTVKLFQALGSFGTCLSYVALAFLPSCDRKWMALVCGFFLGMTYSGGVCGFLTCLMTIAPAYAGTITSLSMVLGQIGYALAPNAVAFVTLMEWPYKWQIILIFAAFLQFLSGVVFSISGSGDTAPWARNTMSTQKVNIELEALYDERR